MKLADYIRNIDKPREPTGNPLEAYAQRCGVTIGYMKVHVLYARKEPRFRLLRALARESEGRVSLMEVLQHFGVPETELSRPVATAA
ncbi:MAG: hypothetical protein KJ884_02045 [Gammaproteobacteria bacterium]|uniref:Uncharacterized protein n=1 Tax=viral metagenome TaxID=1070528 RepID=A0A6M3J854_9ZZZZ|nr:hypothetical protein [Gammaproteobacteria bacterium]MBU1492242.1 hypothetical protein [Gammaproteobacteria bacterium]MBU2066813.1 hypothetical protein [Gammaproteobacteria bacterium]MBU2137371.1 hypothetical protein [Gammaproteobacteria bacterium]MBU2215068.1 hypothetical protein [Gammaproteobacteria bacterium]